MLPTADTLKTSDGAHLRIWRWPEIEGRPTLHWAHGTGFHARVYLPILNALSEHMNVMAWDARGHGESEETPQLHQFKNWEVYYRDMQQLLEHTAGKVWLAGHSLGGATSMAVASRMPEKVHGVLAVDPVIFSRKLGIMFGLLKAFGRGHKMYMSQNASRRRSEFGSKQNAYENFRSKKAFDAWPDDWLRLYVDYGFEDQGDKVVLSCRPEWEAKSFAVSEHNPHRFMKSLDQNVVFKVLVAERESTFFDQSRSYLRRRCPQSTIEVVPNSTHFLPVEHPEKVVGWILDSMGISNTQVNAEAC